MPRLSGRHKIRRYGHIYPSRRSTPMLVLRTILTVIILLVLGFVGWNAYGPVSDYFSGKLAVMSHSANKQSPSSIPDQSPPEPIPQEPLPQNEDTPQNLQSIYLPPDLLANEAEIKEILPKLSERGFNAVMFDLKDASGIVYYKSDIEAISRIEAQSQNAIDLQKFCEMLAEYELIPVGRLSLFADPYASARIDGVGIKYMNTEMLWLDNSAEKGGKGWLNPYSDSAREYLLSLAMEAVERGVKRIVLDHCTFPMGVGMEFANYGVDTNLESQSKAISEMLEMLRQPIEENNAQLSLYISAQAALGQINRYYGGVNPLTLFDDVTIGLMPAQFGDGFSMEGFSLEQPLNSPYETVKSVLAQLDIQMADKKITGMLQGYTATGALEYNKVYTMEDIEAQMRALKEASIADYVLYSPSGNYPS